MRNIGHGRPRASTGGSGPSDEILLEAWGRYLPPEQLDPAWRPTNRQNRRVRKLPARAVVWLVIAIGLWGDLDLPSLWRQVTLSLRPTGDTFTALQQPRKYCLTYLSESSMLTQEGYWW